MRVCGGGEAVGGAPLGEAAAAAQRAAARRAGKAARSSPPRGRTRLMCSRLASMLNGGSPRLLLGTGMPAASGGGRSEVGDGGQGVVKFGE